MQLREPFTLYSHIFFLTPLYFAVILDARVHIVVISVLVIASILFHGSKPKGPIWWHETGELETFQKVFLWADTFAASSLVALNLFVFWQKDFPSEFWYAIIFAIVAVFILLFKTKEQEYDFYHGIWHVFASLITLLAVIA